MHASLADILSDLVQNSIEAGATFVQVELTEEDSQVFFRIQDNGCGMDEETLRRAEDPFWSDGKKHPGRRVGLGIPFLRQTAEQCEGQVEIHSVLGKGTEVKAQWPQNHLDAPPLGDIVLLWVLCLTFEGGYGMNIRRTRQGGQGTSQSYAIDRVEVSEALGGLDDAGALGLLREYITSLEEEIG
ncbi:MAG: ATP-binding protein [Spirochaetales bacterium]|nr:ATP-binding protein [Spirochaetales bacterium]